jgi:hypothetical protein
MNLVVAMHLPLWKLSPAERSGDRIRDYKFCKAKRINGREEVIYLAVDEYVYIDRGWPTTPQDDAELLVNGRRFLLEEVRNFSRIDF